MDTKTSILSVKNLSISIQNTPVVSGVSFDVHEGELFVIMGANGSGKSSLLQAIMGNPLYQVTGGSAHMGDVDLLALTPEKRSLAGIFLAFQYPPAMSGIPFGNFIRLAANEQQTQIGGSPFAPKAFFPIVQNALKRVELDTTFIARSLHEGSSGGEKKRLEVAQMSILQPRIALLDEIDSGVDVDGLRSLTEEIARLQKENGMTVILVTHNTRMFQYLTPDRIAIMSKGTLVKIGDASLAKRIEQDGYEGFLGEPSNVQ